MSYTNSSTSSVCIPDDINNNSFQSPLASTGIGQDLSVVLIDIRKGASGTSAAQTAEEEIIVKAAAFSGSSTITKKPSRQKLIRDRQSVTCKICSRKYSRRSDLARHTLSSAHRQRELQQNLLHDSAIDERLNPQNSHISVQSMPETELVTDFSSSNAMASMASAQVDAQNSQIVQSTPATEIISVQSMSETELVTDFSSSNAMASMALASAQVDAQNSQIVQSTPATEITSDTHMRLVELQQTSSSTNCLILTPEMPVQEEHLSSLNNGVLLSAAAAVEPEQFSENAPTVEQSRTVTFDTILTNQLPLMQSSDIQRMMSELLETKQRLKRHDDNHNIERQQLFAKNTALKKENAELRFKVQKLESERAKSITDREAACDDRCTRLLSAVETMFDKVHRTPSQTQTQTAQPYQFCFPPSLWQHPPPPPSCDPPLPPPGNPPP